MDIRKTPLYDCHIKASAEIVDFAGWQMPIRYPDGIIAEHLYTRKHAGLFDVSHMGRIIFSGKDAGDYLQYVLTSNVASLPVGKSQYCMIPTETGGAVDDAYLYRFVEDEYLLVVNASNKDKDLAHFAGYTECFSDVVITDVSDSLAMIALQGPESETILTQISGDDLPAAGRNNLKVMNISSAYIFVARTGYTGEPLCFELMAPANIASDLWQKMIGLGAKPVGLGARDTLRLEAGLPLYGHELGTDLDGSEIPVFTCPLAKFAVNFSDEKGFYIGKDALAAQPGAVKKTVRQVALTGKGIARQGAKVLCGGKDIGYITSGTMVPYWLTENGSVSDKTSQRAIALVLIDSDIKAGTEIQIDVRGRLIDAVVVPRNLDNKNGKYALPVIQ